MSSLHQSDLPKIVSPEDGDSGEPLLSQRVRSLRLPDTSYQSTGGASWLPWVLCCLLACSSAVLGYLLYARPAAAPNPPSLPPPTTETDTPKAAAVAAANENRADSNIVLRSKGYAIPAHQILVSPKVSGMIQELSIEEGTRVKKGTVLAVLETVDYQSDVARAKALLQSSKQRLAELTNGSRPEEKAQARADLAETQAQLVQLEADERRAVELQKKNMISMEQFDATESKYRAMLRREERLQLAVKLMDEGPRIEKIEAARAEVEQLEAELVKAQWRLDNCTITAPISGTILKKNAEKGNIVNPIAFNGSFSICEMADLSDLEVELSIQERDISVIVPGQKCEVEAEALRNRVFPGVVSRLMPIADRAKGSVQVRVKVTVPPEEEGILKPEMGVIVSFFKK